MDKPELLIMNVLPALGQLNAMLKNIMAQMSTDDPNEAIRCINAGEWVVKMANLLKRVTTMSVSGPKKFVVSEHLKEANVGWMGDNFNRVFLNFVEENVPDATLAVSRLERNSPDASILTELGDKAKTKLAHLFQLMEKQSKGEEGVLFVNGYVNIVYVEDDNGTVWAVGAYWNPDHGYWLVSALSVEVPYVWDAGDQVLSRDS